MVFSSHIFIFYFLPLVFLFYSSVSSKLKNHVLLVSSLFFYGWGAPKFLFLLVFMAYVDFWIANRIVVMKEKAFTLVFIGVALNVFMLFYFKYFNFFVENTLQIVGAGETWSKVILPIGISFVTFQKISYLVDVYRGTNGPQSSFKEYLLFVVLFPQLIAGPIVRYKDVADQLQNRKGNESVKDVFEGLFIFIIGLAKKVLLANVFGGFVNEVFASGIVGLSTTDAWLGMVAYSFQIYFDFSGYSDMAIGLGRMFGFKFLENFSWPYLSGSITEFWKRWHMTLGGFFKDYLYIPLGGNRNGVKRAYVNLTLVFLISGLWHGASWNFVLWGIYHGLFLVIDRLFLLNVLKKLPKLIRVLFSYFLVVVGWVLFKFDTLTEIGDVFNVMFNFENFNLTVLCSNRLIILFVLVVGVTVLAGVKKVEQLFLNSYKESESMAVTIFKGIAIFVLFIICVGELSLSGFNPFIYFKF